MNQPPSDRARLREWCEREAVAADERAAEAERMARAWRDAAEGMRRVAELLGAGK